MSPEPEHWICNQRGSDVSSCKRVLRNSVAPHWYQNADRHESDAAEGQPSRVGNRTSIEIENGTHKEYWDEGQQPELGHSVQEIELNIERRHRNDDRRRKPCRGGQCQNGRRLSQRSHSGQGARQQVAEELVKEGPQRTIRQRRIRDPSVERSVNRFSDRYLSDPQQRIMEDITQRAEWLSDVTGETAWLCSVKPLQWTEDEGDHDEADPKCGED